MRSRQLIKMLFLIFSAFLIISWIYPSKNKTIQSIAPVKNGNKWIVVTSISSPTNDVKRLASFDDWNLVVVADTKTPLDWKLENVHFLSVEYQNQLPFSLVSSLPYKSYTRKNIGYLYAISHGAEWIYDTDDDNKPFDKGLNQFQYEDTVSGVRYRVNSSEDGILLLNADSKTGLDVKFNEFAPPITLSVGTYSPWNSQNTLFHKSAFHTLFLPTTVSFRTTDIWRSFISQKILHLSGLTVSFVPTNAVQFRNAHDYLKDFKDEKQVYEDSGKMIKFLHEWKCSNAISNNLENCIYELMNELVVENLWGKKDSELMKMFLNDLKSVGFEFPVMVGESYRDPYSPSTNETSRDVNCRRMNLEFELIDPKEHHRKNKKRAVQKLNYFGNLVEWCNETGYSGLAKHLPSSEQLEREHSESYVLEKDLKSVLIVVNNFPWKYGIGLIQRLYQPYFATVIFCGSWYPDQIMDHDNFTSIIHPVNYVHINPAEIHNGYFSYHCMTLVKEMGLQNVEGYFFVADDTVFNMWQRIDYSRVSHFTGVRYETDKMWWGTDLGFPAVKRISEDVKNSTDKNVLEAWKRFEDGLRKYGYINSSQTAEDELFAKRGKSISDFFYIPTSESGYYATLMRVFYKNKFFLELAVNTFLKSVNHQTSSAALNSSLWGNERDHWDTLYNKDMVGLHPVKMSNFKTPGENRKRLVLP
ncbi:hypothetical protein CAEBREN_29347 [Caenorhabditis brenneri]|uniref:Uncharacterized protein n=1 Tax=Caenorhabditis brenneri TaxID=135651 RepID=G0MRP2_CAEBE|nr:hypothetical protein CAEBREN_29347 [Caenorhabditis brenneri]